MTEIHSTRAMGTQIRGRRLELDLSQSELAARAGVSRKWIVDVEAGKPTAAIGLVLRVLDALDLDLHAIPRGGVETHDELPDAIDLDALLRTYMR